jgi:hypothetical protein
MKTQGKKSVTIEAEVVRQMLIEKANTGKDVYALVAESWGLYQAAKSGTVDAAKQAGSTRASDTFENSRNRDILNIADLDPEQIALTESFVEILRAPREHIAIAVIGLVKGWRMQHAPNSAPNAKGSSNKRKSAAGHPAR